MIATSVQIKTAKTQKHLYCLVFTGKALVQKNRSFSLENGSVITLKKGVNQTEKQGKTHKKRIKKTQNQKSA